MDGERTLTRNIYLLPDGFRRPVFVFPPDPDQLRDVQQVIQGIGAVPELVLPPVPLRHGQEQKFIDVRAGQGDVSAVPVFSLNPPSPKKPERLQAMPSISSFMQAGVSCSSSGYPHSGPVITGCGPAGSSTAV